MIEGKIKIQKNTSTNYYYTAHFHKKTKIKKEILDNVEWKKLNKIKSSYKVIYRYHSRIDIDNNSSTIKILIDFLRRAGWMIEDTPKFFKELQIIFDPTLEKNTGIIIIENEK